MKENVLILRRTAKDTNVIYNVKVRDSSMGTACKSGGLLANRFRSEVPPHKKQKTAPIYLTHSGLWHLDPKTKARKRKYEQTKSIYIFITTRRTRNERIGD